MSAFRATYRASLRAIASRDIFVSSSPNFLAIFLSPLGLDAVLTIPACASAGTRRYRHSTGASAEVYHTPPKGRSSTNPRLLLEEARKSWNHIVCDKIVYSIDPVNVALDTGTHVAKDYLVGNNWIECHLTFEAKGHSHYVALLKFDKGRDTCRDVRKSESDSTTVNRNPSVLINVTDSVQLPEKTAPDRGGIRSVAWLKRLDNGPCISGDPVSLLTEPIPTLPVPRIENRELGALGIGSGEFGERENQLIQRGSEAAKQVPDDKGDTVRDFVHLNSYSIEAMLDIILRKEGVGLRFVEDIDFAPQSVKVLLGPGRLQIGINQTGRDVLSAGNWHNSIV